MGRHALLSASSSHRWLVCPPSARLCENYEDTGSEYAQQGTDAHSLSSKAVVVHSKKQYRLTHLLEFGHAKRGGGRTKAQPHIAPAEKAGFDLLLSEVEKGVKG